MKSVPRSLWFLAFVISGLAVAFTRLPAQWKAPVKSAASDRGIADKVSDKDSGKHPTNATRHREKSAARLEYEARARRLAREDVVGHFALAQWCARQQLSQCMRWELHEVLREHPDHVGARSMLGQTYHAGQWLPRETAMRLKGLVRVPANAAAREAAAEPEKWVRKYDAERLRHEAHRVLAVQHEANLLLVRLADRDPSRRRDARRALEKLAVDANMPELRRMAARMDAKYAAFWRDYESTHTGIGTMHTGLLTVRATHSRLLGMDSFSTSLGAGSPVTLQLPRLETISIGTTVAVPLGRGTVSGARSGGRSGGR